MINPKFIVTGFKPKKQQRTNTYVYMYTHIRGLGLGFRMYPNPQMFKRKVSYSLQSLGLTRFGL